jgi:hypothetical protein
MFFTCPGQIKKSLIFPNQLYKLNTADLKHATNVVKPLDGSDSQQSTTNPQTGYTQYFQFDRD